MTAITTIKKFRKIPRIIEAMQFNGSSESARAIDLWISSYGESALIDPVQGYVGIQTLEGIMQASVGDWVIRGVQGEFYPCKPDIFNETYEEVVDDDS